MAPVYSSLPGFLWFFSKRHLKNFVGLVAVGIFWAFHFCITPVLVKSIIDRVAIAEFEGVLPVVGPFIAYIFSHFLLLGMGSGYDYFYMHTFPALKADITEHLHDRLLSYPYAFFQLHLSGGIANKISDLAKGTATVLKSIIDDFFCRTLLFLLGVGTLSLVHPLFAGALLVWFALFFGITYLLSKEVLHKTALFSEARSTLMGKIVDGVANIFTIKIFGASRHEAVYVKHYLQQSKNEEINLDRYLLRLKFFQGLSINFLMITTIAILFFLHQRHWITVGDFALVLTLTSGMVDQIFYLALQVVQWSEEIGVLKQALALFAEPVAIEPSPLPSLYLSEGKISLENVSFFYNPFKPVFQNLSLQIAGGEKIGVVGLSGSGKSTLAHLLLRLYDVTSGKILIDDHPIDAFSKESVVSQIGMIPQDPYLFHRSVYENILYGKPHAAREEVIEAAIKAHCHEFILSLPQGYDTLVGERGVKLSGGQRQRITIARAFLKNARILILDEATSALDSITEREIQQSLSRLMEGRTVLGIAHRLSTLSSMDRIIVFEKGKVLEQGTHEELLNQQGRYFELWQLQSEHML